MHNAKDLARMLGERAFDLVRELLPAGRREGSEWKCGDVSGAPGRSLSVHLTGPRAGVWSDFSSSGEHGDALALVAATVCGGDTRAAMAWARRWLGLEIASYPVPADRRPAPRQVTPEPAVDQEAEARRGAARRLFLLAQPELKGTPAAAYLAGRGIDLAELGRQPRSLRFAPALFNRESGQNLPALVAAITSATGEQVAVHRTWLQRDALSNNWTKASLRDPKMTLGSYAGGTIRLWRGASAKPLAQAPAGECVALTEGIEDGLTVALAVPEMRVLCAVSLANLARVELPAAIRSVLICADRDTDNPAAERALQRAIDHFASGGRTVRITMPPPGVKDFNQLLTAGDA